MKRSYTIIGIITVLAICFIPFIPTELPSDLWSELSYEQKKEEIDQLIKIVQPYEGDFEDSRYTLKIKVGRSDMKRSLFYGNSGATLNESEQLLFALNFFAGGVPRSGMIGYFENSSGNEILNAKSALQIIGLENQLRILEDAQRILMKDQVLAPTEEQIELLPRDTSQEEYESYAGKLEAEIAPVEEKLEAIEDALYDGIDRLIVIRGITAKGQSGR